MKYILIFLIVHHFLALFTQTFFLHRYAAHKMFTMSRFWEKVFYVLSWIFQGASYLSPFTYGRMHRMHHAYADTEKDVHSPKYDKTIWRMMNKTKNIYTSIHYGETVLEEKFLGDLPEWNAFDKFAHSWGSRIGWAALYLAFYIHFATEWWMYLFLPINLLMSPIHGAIINWFAHKIGYRNHKVYDTSTNLFPVEIIMLGEGLHNNHHKEGTRANFAQKWFEFDPTYMVILILHGIRVIKIVKD